MSANVTLGGSQSRDFEADQTERVATLQTPGGLLSNRAKNGRIVWITEGGGVVNTTDGNAVSVPIGPGASHRLPNTVKVFNFKAVGGKEFLIYTQE